MIFYFEIILDLEKNYRHNTEFSYNLHLASTNVDYIILYNHNIIIETKKIAVIKYD